MRDSVITLYIFGPMFGLADASPFVTKGLVLMKMSGLALSTDTNGFMKAAKGKLPYVNGNGNGTIVADSAFIRFHVEKTLARSRYCAARNGSGANDPIASGSAADGRLRQSVPKAKIAGIAITRAQ